MKLLLVFALCGITCCLAAPDNCTSNEVIKCIEGPGIPNISDEEGLDKVCRQTKCYLKVYDRCGISAWQPYLVFPVKGYKTIVKFICPKTSKFRRDYIDNAKCIMNATKDIRALLNLCRIEYNGNRNDFCKIIPDGFRCAVNYIKETCGEVAGDVYQIAAHANMDPFDCLLEY